MKAPRQQPSLNIGFFFFRDGFLVLVVTEQFSQGALLPDDFGSSVDSALEFVSGFDLLSVLLTGFVETLRFGLDFFELGFVIVAVLMAAL